MAWQVVQKALSRYTSTDLHETIQNELRDRTYTFTRRWVVWHVIEHDLYHGGEIAYSLGMHGLMAGTSSSLSDTLSGVQKANAFAGVWEHPTHFFCHHSTRAIRVPMRILRASCFARVSCISITKWEMPGNQEPQVWNQVYPNWIRLVTNPLLEVSQLDRKWLAHVGEERFEEIEHPEAAIERVRATYRAKGYDEAWIDARIKNDLIRNELTDEWKDRGAKEGVEFAVLTNELIS